MSKLKGYAKKNLKNIIETSPSNIDVVINRISKYNKIFSWWKTALLDKQFSAEDPVIIEGSKAFLLEALHITYNSTCRNQIIVLTTEDDLIDFTKYGSNITVMRSLFIPNTSMLNKIKEFYPNAFVLRECDTELLKNHLIRVGLYKDEEGEHYDYVIGNRRDCAEVDYLATQTGAKKVFPKWDIIKMFNKDVYHTEYYNTLKEKDFEVFDNYELDTYYPRENNTYTIIKQPTSWDALNIAKKYSEKYPDKKILVYLDESIRFVN